MFHKEQLLRKLYYDPKTGFQGVQKMYNKAHKIDQNINREDVEDFIKHQDIYQLHKEVHRKKEYLKTFVEKIAEQVQIDLIDMRKYSKHNEGYNWIISMIDIFSKYAFTIAVKSKSGKDVLNGFVKLMKQFHEKFGKYPKRVRADEGKEFFNINFNEYLKHKNVKIFCNKVGEESRDSEAI